MIRLGNPWTRAMAALAGLLLASCGNDRLAGTSSGVDNPQLTVGFRDQAGNAMQVTGDLEVYSRDQNPALDPRPLWTIQVRNTAVANLTGDDFRRIREAIATRIATGLSKSGAGSSKAIAETGGSASVIGADTVATTFNLLIRTESRSGDMLMELRYDPVTRAFSRAGGPAVSNVDAHPVPLIRYDARLARSDTAEPGRVYVPGTPFVATLVDSAFAIGALPPGVFPMRMLTPDGYVYSIKDSLKTAAQGVLHQSLPVPLEKLDVAGTDSIPGFAVIISGANTTDLVERFFLNAQVLGIDPANPRVSLLWRQIPTLDTPRPFTARILSPMGLQTEVVFASETVHQFVFSATVGLRTVADTLEVKATRAKPLELPRILQPLPGDTLRLGIMGKIAWYLPTGGDSIRVELSLDKGNTWSPVSYEATSPMGDSGLAYWTPPATLVPSNESLLRVSSVKNPSVQTTMKGYFSLRP